MKLIFKQKVLSFFDEYEIFDENQEVVYTIKSKMAIGRKLKIFDKDVNHIASLESIFAFKPKYKIIIDNKEVGVITKEITFFKQKLNIDCNGWNVDGDFWDWRYEVLDKGNVVAKISKEFRWFNDVYSIDINEEKDALLSLLVVLAIDAIKDDQSNATN